MDAYDYLGVHYPSYLAMLAAGVDFPPPTPDLEATPKTEEPPPEPPPSESPPGLDDVIGNAPAVLEIRTALDAHRERIAAVGDGRTKEARAKTFPHLLLCGPSGCVAGYTRLYDPITGKHPTFEQLHRDNVRPWVQTIHGPERAEVPFIKGRADLFEVCLESGRCITVQQDHRFLTPYGWRKMLELAAGDYISISNRPASGARPESDASRPLSSLDISPSIQQPSARRCSGKAQGSPARYSVCSCLCGTQPRAATVVGQSSVPLPGDAGEPSREWREDDPAHRQERTRQHPPLRRRAMPDCCCRPGCSAGTEFSSGQSLCGRDACLLQEDSPCAPETIPVGNIPQSAGGELPTPLRTFFERDSLASPLWFTWDSIKSITLKALNQTFYDLVVPLAHHYLAEGIWNHNTGKTMLAEIIAHEVGRPLRVGMGQSLQNPARVADFLLSLRAGDVLFVDEIHGLKPACQETFYRAMEGRVLMPIDKPGEPVRAPLPLPPFTLIGATTDEWRLMEPLLQRFEYRIRLDRMSVEELSRAISQRAKARGLSLTDDAAVMIAQRAHGTPRLAVMLLARCMDVALAGKATTVTGLIVERACEISRLDALGLDSVERHYLSVLLHANGKPVRLNVIASQLDQLSRRTVEGRVEPTLIWMGLIEKRPDGRILTAEGRRYLTTGIVPGK